jgi:hypothetical protein
MVSNYLCFTLVAKTAERSGKKVFRSAWKALANHCIDAIYASLARVECFFVEELRFFGRFLVHFFTKGSERPEVARVQNPIAADRFTLRQNVATASQGKSTN